MLNSFCGQFWIPKIYLSLLKISPSPGSDSVNEQQEAQLVKFSDHREWIMIKIEIYQNNLLVFLLLHVIKKT